MWDLWWTKWHWDKFILQYFGFPLSISFHRWSNTWKNEKINLHHSVAQYAWRLRCVRGICCGALHQKKNPNNAVYCPGFLVYITTQRTLSAVLHSNITRYKAKWNRVELIYKAAEAWNHELPLLLSSCGSDIYITTWKSGGLVFSRTRIGLNSQNSLLLENQIGNDDWQCRYIRGRCS
jgi:hypothetical protein